MADWEVTVPVAVGGDPALVVMFADSLRAQLEAVCPTYRPQVLLRKDGQLLAVFATVRSGTEQTATGKATYWLRRAVQRGRKIRWSASLIGEGITCTHSS